MGEIIVTFQDKKDKEFVTPPMQVPADFTAEAMGSFLNTFLNQDKSYAFFYDNEQITKLPDIVGEETVNIEYISVTRITSESASINVQSTITSIQVRRNTEVDTDSVILCTVDGYTLEYSLASGLDMLHEYMSYCPIRAVSADNGAIYILTTTNKVVDIQNAEVVYENSDTIRCISYSNGVLAIGMANNDVVIMKDKKEYKKIKTKDEIGKMHIAETDGRMVLVIGMIPGAIEVVDIDTMKRHTITLSRPIMAMGYSNGKIYTGGIGGIITVCTMTEVEDEYQSDVKFISRIECGTVFFGYTTDNKVYIRDKENYIGTHLLELKSNITDMKISGKRLFVAEGNTLKVFNIFED